jgi:hypothetical protein
MLRGFEGARGRGLRGQRVGKNEGYWEWRDEDA